MKASELKPGTDYAVCSGDPMNTWETVRKVRVVEAPVVGWASKYSWGSTYKVKGKVNPQPNARKDNALVIEYQRQQQKERNQKFAEFDLRADRLKAQPTWASMTEEEQQDALTAIMDSIKQERIYEPVGEDRVRLRDIKMTWAEYEAMLEERKERKRRHKVEAATKQQRAEALNEKLTGLGLVLENIWLGSGRGNAYKVRAAEYGNDWDLIKALESIVERLEAAE